MRDRIKRIVGESGMGDRFLRRTFSTFQLTDDNKRAAAAARRYGGTLKGGRSIYFEAKHTDDERIEQRRLTQEQQDDLEAHHKLGAIAFVLVSVSLTDFYRVPWPVWRDMAEIYGRKYMTHAELSRYEVPATAGFIKFLHGIESETLEKEDAHDPTP